MTAVPQPGKPNTPEQHRTKVERLLYGAASWAPDSAPTDFVAEAMRKRTEKANSTQDPGATGNRWRKRPQGIWWGFGTVGVAAASLVFTLTGNMVDPERLASPTPAIHSVQTADATPIDEDSSKPPIGAVEPKRPDTGNSLAPPIRRQASSVGFSVSSGGNRTRRWGGRRFSSGRRSHSVAREQAASSQRALVGQTSGTPSMARAIPSDTRQKPTANPNTSGITATPAPEIYETDDGRVFIPVVVTHTSEDGTEVSYTPTVVEMAYQPVNY